MVAGWLKPDFKNCMCLALWASGLWIRYAALQNLILSFPWIGPPRSPPWRNPRKGRDHILPSGNLATTSAATATAATPEVVKKKRGRPRKNPVSKSDEVMSQNEGKSQDEGSLTNGDVSEPLVKRRAVGRPKKGTASDAESRDREQVRGAQCPGLMQVPGQMQVPGGRQLRKYDHGRKLFSTCSYLI